MNSTHEPINCRSRQPQPVGAFFSKLSPAAIEDLESIESPSDYAANQILFSEREPARGVFVVLSGEVKLSINSSDGRRLSLRIAKKAMSWAWLRLSPAHSRGGDGNRPFPPPRPLRPAPSQPHQLKQVSRR
jgi:hypothetical protein